MSNRALSQRYSNVKLREKLAGEYVLGTQTPRVRRRLEALIEADPTWWVHIEQWQQYLSSLSPATDLEQSEQKLRQPPKNIWRQVSAVTIESGKASKQWFWWLPVGLAFALVLGIWVRPLSIIPSTEVAQTRPVSYIALMSSTTEQNHFALIAYQGDSPGESSLRMQENVAMDKVEIGKAMVWMRDSTTGKMTLLDSLQAVSQIRYMSATEWKRLKNSSELVVTANRNPESTILYRGSCIELNQRSSS